MEDKLPRTLRSEEGAALVVVLLAIVILLPPTLVLSTLALRWQRRALDYRDTIGAEFAAHAGFEQARNRIAGKDLGLAPGEGSSFEVGELRGLTAATRVSRESDVVVTADGRVLSAAAAKNVDLDATGTDPEGRVVYRYRKLEVFMVQVDVLRRPALPAVRLYGVVARLPDGSITTLGVSLKRGFFTP